MTDALKKKIVKWFWFLLVTPFAALILLLILVWAFADIPSIEQLENPDTKLATQVIAEEGEILTTYHIENRTFVSYEELAPSLVQAAVATEDKRFYEHSGVDLQSLGRVLFKTLLSHDSSQGGGSTITQQLAKTLYPRGEHVGKAKMVWIKLKEWITAIKLERNYTKEEIVVMYLNAIFFGSNSYGISSAASQFFGKKPSELLTEESAVLVGMVNKPTRYIPAINPESALRRRNLVLERMGEMKYITPEERDSLKALPIVLATRKGDRTTGIGPYFRDMLRRTMNAEAPRRSSYYFYEDYQVDSLLWADDPVYGWLNKNFKSDGTPYDLDRDGLRIYTTINYKMQRYAEEAITEHLGKDLQPAFWRELKYRRNPPFMADTEKSVIEKNMQQARRWSDRNRMMKASGYSQQEIDASFDKPVRMRVFTWEAPGYKDTTLTPNDSIRYYKSFFRAAFMAIEPGTGHIRAYVGGPDYRYFKYDNVRQGKRQVGSTIKPFLYTQAMESGMTPCDAVLNSPVVIATGTEEETWSPQDPHADGTMVDLTWGLAHSSNSVSAYLMKQLGAPSMVSMMRKMGIGGFVDPVVALCVGSADLSVYDMVTAYNTYPSGGVYTTPIFVTRIEDSDGNVLGQFSDRRREALSLTATGEMIHMMRAVVDSGTAIRLRVKYGLKGEIAGKTGTTNDNSDGWFIGYTPRITAGVWVGAEDRYVHFANTNLGQGANMALPIWGIWMKKVLSDPTLGISETDVFHEHLKGSWCTPMDEETPEKTDLENYY
ncbi:MAG: transglycosylase domain-containing protein, partial [Bacteroidales bacterium]|nr:transglycosylase domain-containing protein [Bacteroidales bacterium]